MDKNSTRYKMYVEVLKKELIPAMGCTEPIAIALAAAKAREILGQEPDRVLVKASGNLIKNAKSVTVPNTDGLKGIEAAAAAGIVAGQAEKQLEVISQVTETQKAQIQTFLKEKEIQVDLADSPLVFDLVVDVSAGEEKANVRIANEHTNFVYIRKNDEVLLDKNVAADGDDMEDEKTMSVDEILDFARTCDLEDVREVISRQIQYNTSIAEEGIKNPWGAQVGRVILNNNNASDVKIRAKAKAAAGSDARMSGCEMPVVINSGSGNQGITVSIPIIEYAKELGSDEDTLYRALVMANLLGLYQKAWIGRLSAYCGAVSAGCAAGAGIGFLMGESDWIIKHTVVNCLAITSGMICDGAKPSCAGKIAAAVDTALLALEMAKENQQFRGGEGIVKKGIEKTISNVGKLGKDGMAETDKEILRLMIKK